MMSAQKCKTCGGLGYIIKGSRMVTPNRLLQGAMRIAPRCSSCRPGAFAFRKISVLDWMPSV